MKRRPRLCNCDSRYEGGRPHDHKCPRVGLRPRSYSRLKKPEHPGGKRAMSFKIGLTLWNNARHQAIKESVEPAPRAVVTNALEFWLSRTTARASEKLRMEHAGNVQVWHREFLGEHNLWGGKLDPTRNLAPQNLTPALEDLVVARLDVYGLSDLMKILYAVPDSDYHMGRGNAPNIARGPRLKVEHILETSAIEELLCT